MRLSLNVWEKSGLSRGNSLCKGPEAGRCHEEKGIVRSEVGNVSQGKGQREENSVQIVWPLQGYLSKL